MYTLCKATIKINEVEYECECEDGHTGPHVTRVITGPNTISGFDWDIDDGGAVILGMPSLVAEIVFEIYKPEQTIPDDAPDSPF